MNEINEHIDTLYRAKQRLAQEEHQKQLLEATSAAIKTNNAGALLPAQARCYIDHIKSLTRARAECIVEAYTSFDRPVDKTALADLERHHQLVLSVRADSFRAQAELTAKRTNRHGSLPFGLTRMFAAEADVALLEGRSLLDKQRIMMTNRPKPQPVNVYNTVNGHNGRIVGGNDNSSNSRASSRAPGLQRSRNSASAGFRQRGIVSNPREASGHPGRDRKEAAETAYSRFVASLADHVSLLTAATHTYPFSSTGAKVFRALRYTSKPYIYEVRVQLPSGFSVGFS